MTTSNLIFQITNTGVNAAANANQGGPKIDITSFSVGSAYGYTPSATDTALHGTTLYTGQISSYSVTSNDEVNYVIQMDQNVGSFYFGEIGLFDANGNLFALGALAALQEKVQASGSNPGNVVSFQVKLVLTNIAPAITWVQNTISDAQLLEVAAPAGLPTPGPVAPGNPNVYSIQGGDEVGNVTVAVRDTALGLWSFSTHGTSIFSGSITTSSSASGLNCSSLVAANFDFATNRYILQFTSGTNKGNAQYVGSITNGALTTTSAFQNAPALGDTFTIYESNYYRYADYNFATDSGAANSYVLTTRYAMQTVVGGMIFSFTAANSNTGASTVTILGVTYPLYGRAGALQGGEITGGARVEVLFHNGAGRLLSASSGAVQVGNATQSGHAVALGQLQNSSLGLSLASLATTGAAQVATNLAVNVSGLVVGVTPPSGEAAVVLANAPSGYTDWLEQLMVNGVVKWHVDSTGNAVAAGNVTAASPPQYDQSNYLSTTSWVWQQLGNFRAAAGIGLTSSTSVGANQMGVWFQIQATGVTVTLPTPASCPTGGAVWFVAGNYTYTIAGATNLGSTVAVNAGESVCCINDGAGGWFIIRMAPGNNPTFTGSVVVPAATAANQATNLGQLQNATEALSLSGLSFGKQSQGVTFPYVAGTTPTVQTSGVWITGGEDTAGLGALNDLAIQTWYGVSISPTISGEPIAQGTPAWSVNARTGEMWTAGNAYIGGYQTLGVGPAQWDASNKVPTTAWVQSALGNFSGVVASVATSTTLTATAYGNVVQVATSGITVTLPPPAGQVGGAIWFYPEFMTGSFTINVTGAGEFIYAPTCGCGTTNTSITVNAGEWVCLMNRAGTEWDVVAGSWLHNHQTSQPVVMLTGLQATTFYGQVTRAAGQAFLMSSTSNVGVYEDPSGNGPGDLVVRTGVGTNNSYFIFENNGNFSIPGTYYGSGMGLNLPTSFSGTGYVKLPGNGSFGIILQWGQTGSIPTGNNNSGQTSSPFPIAFPNACLSVQLTTTYGFNNGSATDVPVVNSWNSNSFQWQFWSPNNGNGAYSPWVQFFAVGY